MHSSSLVIDIQNKSSLIQDYEKRIAQYIANEKEQNKSLNYKNQIQANTKYVYIAIAKLNVY